MTSGAHDLEALVALMPYATRLGITLGSATVDQRTELVDGGGRPVA